jgi:hypothetical protein
MRADNRAPYIELIDMGAKIDTVKKWVRVIQNKQAHN